MLDRSEPAFDLVEMPTTELECSSPEGTLWQSIKRRRIVELYQVMRTTSAVRHFTNDRDPLHHPRDSDTRQALVELTIPATKKYVAQRQAGRTPGTPSIQAGCPRMRLRRPRFPKASQLRSGRRESFLWCALTSGLWVRSTRSSIGLASSEELRCIRWYGTSCSRRKTKVLVERSRPWPWRKNRGSASYSGSLRRTPLPASFRWANPFTNHAGSHGSTLRT